MFTRLPVPAWFRRPSSRAAGSLGHLERQVMEIVWTGGDGFSVHDVRARLPRAVAYTTVMTTLDRLFKKGFVARRQVGRAYVYTAALARDEMEARIASGLLADVLSSSPEATKPFLSNLVDAVGDTNHDLLDDLERLVREKRARLKRDGA
jgi:predicted transcriptional regulator